MKALLIGSICFFLLRAGTAQDWKSEQVDKLFEDARNKAFAGDRTQSRVMLYEILKRSPSYEDVRVFLARTYMWDGQYDSARSILRIVLAKTNGNREALLAMADADAWNDQYESALSSINSGLKIYPNDEDLLYKKASYLKQLGRELESAETLQTLLSVQPAHKKAGELLKELRKQNLKNAITGSYSADFFSRTFSTAQFAYVQAAHTFKWGSGMARVNYSNRFNQSGTQAELDLYPRLVKGTYGYFNYGYSASTLYPVHRMGAEIFSKLPKSFEISAGLRCLNYGSGDPVTMYTGTVGWYYKNNWISMRSYFTPGSVNSFSVNMFFRHYLQDGNNYVGISGGFGFSPDDRRIQSSSGLSADNVYMLQSQRIGLYWQKTFAKDWMVTTTVFVSRQELSFEHANYVWITSPMVSLRKAF